MDDVEGIFAHLLNYQADLTFAPDVVVVSNIDEGVDLELINLLVLLSLLVRLLPFQPIILDFLIFAVFNQLVDYVVHFEADLERLVADNDILVSVKIAHEACLKEMTRRDLEDRRMDNTYLLENQVILQTRLAIGVAAERSYTFLDEFKADRTDEFLERFVLSALFLSFRDLLVFRLAVLNVQKLLHHVVARLKLSLNPDSIARGLRESNS